MSKAYHSYRALIRLTSVSDEESLLAIADDIKENPKLSGLERNTLLGMIESLILNSSGRVLYP